MNRIFIIIVIIIIVGGGIQLFGLDKLDVCDNDDLIENLCESNWKTKGGLNLLEFNENGTFSLTTNGGENHVEGTYHLTNDCNLIFPNAKGGSEFYGVKNRHIVLTVENAGSTEISLSSTQYNTFILKDIGTMLKESDFAHLTQRD
ncbi:MAG: hypothetical protein VR77_08510 [Flavobacteriales bacterium BRH_c54]|nr:MAG: hypothetical protein VR77_08510 [Flavobacteriales bacterium BRH_c54]